MCMYGALGVFRGEPSVLSVSSTPLATVHVCTYIHVCEEGSF